MKILYLMHLDKGWIKQRPQFIAEELSKTNILTNKLTTINSLITSTIKLRNLIIKSKSDSLKHI